MTFTMVFNLPDEEAEMNWALTGGKAISVLWDLDQRMRSILKYEEHSEETDKVVQELRDLLNSMCNDMGVRIE
jgi:hypothetical protein